MRRKLILSYVFLGFVPVILVVAFALAASVVLYINVAAYVFHEGFGNLIDDVYQIRGDVGRRDRSQPRAHPDRAHAQVREPGEAVPGAVARRRARR